jgi:hypothetical protein
MHKHVKYNIHVVVSWAWHSVVWYVGTNVVEEHAATILISAYWFKICEILGSHSSDYKD